MPTFDLTVRVNVPGLGQRDVIYPGVVAASMQAAFEQVKSNVIIKPILIQETAP